MNVGHILAFAASRFPERIALIFEDKKFSFREFNQRTNQFAQSLLRLGLQKGDKIAVLLYNSNPFVEIYLGTAKAGGVFTPINFRLAAEEILYILDHSDARFFVYGEEFIPVVQSIRSRLTKIEYFLSAGKEPYGRDLHYETLLAGSGNDDPNIPISEEDECQLMYTSGTTGRPKGAMITHGNVLWNLFNIILGREEREGEISLVIGPLYHTAALNNHFMIRVALPGTSILIKTFDPKQTMEIIAREKVTVISGAPAMFHHLLALPDIEKYDTRSITKCTTGSSILPEETKVRLLKLFPNIKGIYDVYGCTEASPCVTVLKAEDSLRKKESVGPPLPFVQVKVVDEMGREIPVGEIGELICKGPNVMKGYYKDAQATRDALKGGWLHTGDLARLDDEGFVYIVGRKKDMIISGGENIYPREIEEVLYRHPKIQEAAVIGVPDPLWGESVKAFVVLKEGAAMSAEEVVEYCKSLLASYKKPKSVEFVKELPRNPSGKVLKSLLRNKVYLPTP